MKYVSVVKPKNSPDNIRQGEQGMAWNLNINQRSKTQNQIMDVGLYFDHLNVCICCLMNISKKTLKNPIFQCVLCYHIWILFDPHILLDEEHEMP